MMESEPLRTNAKILLVSVKINLPGRIELNYDSYDFSAIERQKTPS